MPKTKTPYPGYEKLERVVTVRTRKFLTNKLLKRRQMVLDISHMHVRTPSKKLIRRKVAQMFKVKDPNSVVLFGFRSQYGGGKTTGFCLIYDDFKARKRYDYKHRLIRDKLAKAREGSRKQKKELKNRVKKLVGRKKAAAK